MMRETARAQQAWADYLAHGVSLEKLGALYVEQRAKGQAVPTVHVNQLKRWSAELGWQKRLEQIQQERIEEIMHSGMALVHERVAREKIVEELLFDEVMDPEKRWPIEPKWVGGMENGERVDLVRFNHRLVEQWRGLHKDLAEETGGRKRTVEHTGADGGPIEIKPVDYRQAVEPLLTEDETDDHEAS